MDVSHRQRIQKLTDQLKYNAAGSASTLCNEDGLSPLLGIR